MKWLAACAVLLLLPVAATAQLSAYQDGPIDMSDWRAELRIDGYTVRNTAATPLFLAEIPDPATTVYVIAGLERSYGLREKAAIDDFVRGGGVVVFGDNGGSVPNSFARDYGVLYFGHAVFDGSFEFNQSFVRAHVPELEVSPLLVNPTGLMCAVDECLEQRYASSSANSFLDLNRNGEIDAADDVGPFSLMVHRPIGDGSILFLPTGGFATNDIFDDPETNLFLEKLLKAIAPNAKTVVFDESRHAAPANEAVFVSMLTILGGFTSIPLARFLVTACFVLAAALLLRRARPLASWRHRFDDRAVIEIASKENAGDRLARLMRLKIRLDHQLVDPTEEDLLRLAPDEKVRSLLRHPHSTNAATLREIMTTHLPDGVTVKEDATGGHAIQSPTTPSPPDAYPY